MLVHSDVSTVDAVDRPPSSSSERGIEVEALLDAAAALHRDGILTDAEYETKHRRLTTLR